MEDRTLLKIFEQIWEAIKALQQREEVRRKEMEALRNQVETLKNELRTLVQQRPR